MISATTRSDILDQKHRQRHLLDFLAALFGLSLALSISAAEILTALFLLMWGWTALRSARTFRPSLSALDRAIVVYYVWGVFCSMLAHSVSVPEALSRYSSLLLYGLFGRAMSSDTRVRLLRWFVFGSLFAATLGVIQYFSGIYLQPTGTIYSIPRMYQNLPGVLIHYLSSWAGRAHGTRNHPLTFAEGLIPAFAILWASVFSSQAGEKATNASRLCQVASLALITAGIVFSETRGVILGAVGGLVVLIFMWRRYIRLRVTIPTVLAFLTMSALLPSSLTNRMLSTVSPSVGSASDQQSKLTRLELWRQSWTSIKANPITGVGLEGANFVITDLVTGQSTEWSESHNIFLQTAVDTGWFGFAIFLWVLGSIGFLIFRSDARLPGLFLAILVSFLLAGLTESWTGDREVTMIFWAFVGFIVAENSSPRYRTIGPAVEP